MLGLGPGDEGWKWGWLPVRVMGWMLLLAGTWALWEAVIGEEPWGAGGLLLVMVGLALVSARARALAAWIGQGVLTGLCIMTGLGLVGFGGVMLLAYGRFPVQSILLPVVFLSSGLSLTVIGLRRLWRLRGLPH